MRFLLLILIVAPILGQEFHNHRERRQTHTQAQQPNYQAYSQAPAQIKQILAAQQARDPIVHLPPLPVPNLAPAKPIQPQYLTQNQAYQYRPNVQIGQAPAQPTYKQIPVRPAVYSPPASAQQQQYASQYRANYAQAQPQPQPHFQPQQRQLPQPQPHFQPQPLLQPRQLPQPQPLPQPRALPQLKQVPQLQQATQLNYQYSKNLPPELQQLLLIQQNLPNVIPQGQNRG